MSYSTCLLCIPIPSFIKERGYFTFPKQSLTLNLNSRVHCTSLHFEKQKQKNLSTYHLGQSSGIHRCRTFLLFVLWVLCVRPCLKWPAVERNSPTSEPILWTVKNHFTPETVNKTTAQFNLVSSNRLSIPAGSPTLNGQWNKKAKHLLHPSQLKILGETDISQGL